MVPDIHVLDRFSQRDLEAWSKASQDLDDLHATLYLATETDRRRLRADLIDAVNAKPAAPCDFQGWCRMFDYRWANTPLSSAGSLRGVGGRFNVGSDIALSLIAPFPALYIADSQETAHRERYQLASEEEVPPGLTASDLALGVSTCTIRVNGHVERVLDIADPMALAPMCRVLAKVRMPADVARILKRLKLSPHAVRMIKTPGQLQKAVMDRNWRIWPMQFDVPSLSPSLAELAIAAGYEAIRYRSSKTGSGRCLAVFSASLMNGTTHVELADAAPSGVAHRRLDMKTADFLAGWEYVSGSRPGVSH